MEYILTIDQLNHLVALGEKEPILVGGELVYTTYEKAELQSEKLAGRYVAQPPRTASRRSLLDKNKKYLYLGISRDAVRQLNGYGGEILLAADQYLAYGLQKSSSSNLIVLGGGANPEGQGFSVEGMVFTDQQLEQTFERNIQSEYDLDLNLKDIVDKYPKHEIHWCDPLPAPPETQVTRRRGFVLAGGAPLIKPIKRKVHVRAQGEDEERGLLPAAGIALAGFAVFAAVYAVQWHRFEAERKEFAQAVYGYEEQYTNSSQSLELLRHRDFALTEESQTQGRVALLNQLVGHVSAIRNAVVNSVSVYNNRGDQGGSQVVPGAEDFMIELALPQSRAAREQARPIVTALSQATGMTVQVIEHRSTKHNDLDYWLYRIGGQINAN